ncbi:MAG: lysoplasmalogenase family protein [Victivallales bacterium]|nr:lysoplasmalogenase family protein [Victivallales bacterium]
MWKKIGFYGLWLLPAVGLGLLLLTRQMQWLFFYTPALLLAALPGVIRRQRAGTAERRVRWLWAAWLGLAVTLGGDYFLAIRGSALNSVGYLYGIGGFALAHLLWLAFFSRNSRINLNVAVVLLLGFGSMYCLRLWSALPSPALRVAVGLYMLLSIANVSLACNARPRAFICGIGALFFSDLMIVYGCILGISRLLELVGPVYVAALFSLAAALANAAPAAARPGPHAGRAYLQRAAVTVYLGSAAVLICLVRAMEKFPSGSYRLDRDMFSHLGRTRIGGFAYPLCQDWFWTGMVLGIATIGYFAPAFNCFAVDRRRRRWIACGFMLNTAGLLIITLVPEDVSMWHHNVGCLLAGGGGLMAVLAATINNAAGRMGRAARYGWCLILVTAAALFGFFFWRAEHGMPFAPGVPVMQKIVIVAFVLWLWAHAAILLRDLGAFRAGNSSDRQSRK